MNGNPENKIEKYHLNVNLVNFNSKHAGSKAVQDCTSILEDLGYKSIQLHFRKSPFLIFFSLFKLAVQLSWLIFIVKPGSLIITQYPLIGINRFFKWFIYILKLKRCFFACVIHDLNSLRYQEPGKKVRAEISNLNAYDVIISHNNKMSEWLKAKGVKTVITELGIFDYLHALENRFDRAEAFEKGNRDIAFAGNLSRGEFIYDLNKIEGLHFYLYGPASDPESLRQQANVSWEGVLDPHKLVEKLKGNFGLVWDGDHTAYCGGEFGGYLDYNNPHKLSLYLASGLPVILPQKAALSEFVEKHAIGICVNSLHEIKDKLEHITLSEYEHMCKNVIVFNRQLKEGAYFRSSLKRVEACYRFSNKTAPKLVNEPESE